jgi:hypothetical protein
LAVEENCPEKTIGFFINLLGKEYFIPKIYEYLGLIFYFYSNEHEPIHVHVAKAERETVFELILENGQLIKIGKRRAKLKSPLTAKEEKEAMEFIIEYHKKIVDKWVNFFVFKKNVKVTKITRKLK